MRDSHNTRRWMFDRPTRLHWHKTRGRRWYNFWTDDLSAVGVEVGVYIIALALPGEVNRMALYIGEGKIRERLRVHRRKPVFKRWRGEQLVFTWTKTVSKRSAWGIEGRLIHDLTPLFCISSPIGGRPVNVPRNLIAGSWDDLRRYIETGSLEPAS